MKNAGNAPSAMQRRDDDVSNAPPRRQAAIIPTVVPRTNAIRNATPTRKIEYGSVRPMTSDTGAG